MWPRRKPVRVRPVTPSQCGRSGISEASYASRGGFDSRSRDHWAGGATGSAAPLHGEGCGFESHAVHAHQADVAQLGEARRSDRRQCRFESDRQYQLDVAQWERTGFGSRGVGGSSPPVQTQCEVVELVPRLALNQEVRVRTVASQPSMSLQSDRPVAQAGVPSGSNGRGFESRRPSGRSSAVRALDLRPPSLWFSGRSLRPGQLRRTGFLHLA